MLFFFTITASLSAKHAGRVQGSASVPHLAASEFSALIILWMCIFVTVVKTMSQLETFVSCVLVHIFGLSVDDFLCTRSEFATYNVVTDARFHP